MGSDTSVTIIYDNFDGGFSVIESSPFFLDFSKYIFIPAGGVWSYKDSPDYFRTEARYWSITINSTIPSRASYLYFKSSSVNMDYLMREFGYSIVAIRPLKF